MEKSDLNMKMIELQMMQGQMEQLQQQRTQIEMKKMEIETTLSALKGIEDGKHNELMIPLGSGVFVPGKIEDHKHAIYAIGSKTAVKNTIPKAKDYLTKQLTIVNDAHEEVVTQATDLQKKAQGMIAELEAAQAAEGHVHGPDCDHEH